MTFWHVPYRRNPYFIGREQLFQQLHTTFSSRQGIVTQALTGLGGIGKTQTALEYAYRNQHAYQAIFWVSVETRAVLLGDFLKLAEVLDLPEHEVQDQEKIVAAVRHWLETHERWLLILDNSEDVALAQELLPTKGQGHILLTTRDAATGTAALGLPLEVLPEDEGISFLLRRAKILPETEKVASLDASLRQKAQAIVQEVGGLPLALDQAGAYIEETNCGLADYLALYQQHSKEILRRRGRLVTDHPDPVTVTWALSFKQIKLASKAAADLLYCCAYLFSEGIPESFFAEAASELPPTLRRAATDPLRWNGTLEVLRHYSLLGRQPENKTLSLHRLVQVVLRADLKKPAERRWVERVVRMLNTLFPDPDDAAGWPTCQRYLPHAQVAAQLMKQTGLTLLEGPRLLNHAGQYLQERGLYPEAKPYHEQALSIQEQSLGPVHPEIAASLHELAALSWHQELDDQAIAYNQRALSIRRQTLEPLHPDIARSLTGLAASYAGKGDNDSAVPLLQEAIAIWEQVLGRDHPDVATGINNLAGIYVSQGQYDQAEALYQRALGILEQDLESHGPKVGMLLDNMAKLYAAQGKYEQAEPLYQQAIALKEQWLGSMHPNLATSFSHLAKLYVALGNYEQAEAYYRKAIEIFEQALGPAYAPTQEALEDYVSLLRLAQREAEAVVIEKRLKVVKEVPT